MLSAKTMVSTLRTSSHSKLLRFVIVDSNTFNAYKSVIKTFSTVRTASTMRLSPQLLYKIILRASAVGSTNIGSILIFASVFVRQFTPTKRQKTYGEPLESSERKGKRKRSLLRYSVGVAKQPGLLA